MISYKHKDTTFSSPLNHYQYACRRALSAIPGIKKAFVNFLIETLFTLFKSFLLSGIRLINLDSAVLMTFGSHKQAYGRSV